MWKNTHAHELIFQFPRGLCDKMIDFKIQQVTIYILSNPKLEWLAKEHEIHSKLCYHKFHLLLILTNIDKNGQILPKTVPNPKFDSIPECNQTLVSGTLNNKRWFWKLKKEPFWRFPFVACSGTNNLPQNYARSMPRGHGMNQLDQGFFDFFCSDESCYICK